MALSGREVLLVLRAQDRATSVINRLSSTMSKLDRDAIASSMRASEQSTQNLKALQRQVHDVEYQYQRMTLDARKAYMEAGKDSKTRSEAYQKAMLEAREFRVENQRQIRLAKQATEDQIAQAKQVVKSINEEKAAQKEAGKALMAQGTMAIATGTSMVYMGAQGLRAYGGMVKAAADYDTAARYTFTQVDKGKASLKQIEDIGLEVGKKVPAAFDQIQPALYDIWSSIDVNVNQSKKLLTQFAKDTIAGQTDMSVATRANLAIMNAYGISVKDASKVSDFMFQLVRKGVGTYTQFANTIGRVIPSAKKAGVSLDDLGGTLTFLTRNGLSAAMAATSSARAFDALSNPKTADNLKALGINIINAQGNLKPIPKILGMMNDKMKGMSDAEKNTFLSSAFNRSGGTIQAMRAFNLIFKDFDTYKKRLGEMKDDSGAAETAFKQMADSPKVQWQKFLNEVKELEIELGKKLLPTGLKLVGWITNVLKWFDSLNPTLKSTIVYAGAIGSALMILMGAITIVVGGAAVLVGGLKVLGVGSIAATGSISKFTIGLAALATGLLTAYKGTNNLQRGVGILESAMGGAVAGSVFGPWGMAIGGAVGAIGGLIAAWKGSKNAADDAKTHYASITDTLNHTTAAYTKNTVAAIANNLQTSKGAQSFVKYMSSYGVSVNTIAKAATGNKSALEKVNAVMSLTGNQTNELAKANQNLQKRLNDVTSSQGSWQRGQSKTAMNIKGQIDANNKLINQNKSLTDFWTGQVGSIEKQQYALKNNIAQLNAYKLAAKGMPKDLALNITSGGGQKTIAEVKQIAAAYQGLTKKDYKILLSAEGIPATKANIQKVVTYVQNAVNQAQGIAKSGGAGIGSSLVNGAADAINAAAGAIAAAGGAAVAHAINVMKEEADAHSPSRKTIKLGQDIGNGLQIGLRKTTGKNKKAASGLVKDMLKEMQKGASTSDVLGPVDTLIRKHISGKGASKKEDNHIKAVQKQYNSLMKQTIKFKTLNTKTWSLQADKMPLSKAVKQVNKDLKAAQQHLTDAQNAYNSFQQQITSSITDFGSMSNLTQPTDVFGNTQSWTAANIDSQLQQKLQTIKQFGSNLQTLLSMGFSKAVYQEVVSMGPDAGSQFAAALIQATPDQMNSINSSVAGINSLGNTIGTAAADQLYGAGVQAAQGLVNGLTSQQDKVSDAAAAVAKSIEKAVKKALKIKSPSRVAIGLATNFGGTMAEHLYRQRKDVGKSAYALGKAVDVNFADPRNSFASRRGALPPVVGGTSGSAKAPVQITQHITTQEIDPRKHAADLGWELVSRYNL